MEDLDLDYSGSGVKTLRILSYVFLVIGILGFFALMPNWIDDYDDFNILVIAYSALSLISGAFMYAICLAIAKIAEYQMYQCRIIELKIEEDRKSKRKAQENEQNGDVDQ